MGTASSQLKYAFLEIPDLSEVEFLSPLDVDRTFEMPLNVI
jgi:hypothetical protein